MDSSQDLKAAVSLLEPHPGQVVVVTGSRPEPSTIDALVNQFPEGVLFVLLDSGSSIELLDEEQMRTNGWVRTRPAP